MACCAGRTQSSVMRSKDRLVSRRSPIHGNFESHIQLFSASSCERIDFWLGGGTAECCYVATLDALENRSDQMKMSVTFASGSPLHLLHFEI